MKALLKVITGMTGMFLIFFWGVGCGPDDPTPPVLTPVDQISTNSVATNSNLAIVQWTEISSPLRSGDEVEKIAFLGSTIFLLSSGDLYRSQDGAQNWRRLGVNLGNETIHSICDISIDGRNIYLGTDQGLVVSSDYCGSFSWVFKWDWDPVTSVDFIDGYGWGWIASWGSRSGPWRITPATHEGEWQSFAMPYSVGSANVFADPYDPAHIAYIGTWQGYGAITTDAGKSWKEFANVICVGKFENKPFVCSRYSYSLDRGETWFPLGVDLTYNYDPFVAMSADDSLLFTALNTYDKKGVAVGKPGGPWKVIGLTDQYMDYLAVGQGKVWATIKDKIFVADLTEITQQFNAQ